MSGELIPCPVCGGELTVAVRAGARHVDCAARHHARTDAVLYEELRLRTRLDELEHFLGMPAEARCRDHVWAPVEELPDLQMVVCRRCLALSVVSGPQ